MHPGMPGSHSCFLGSLRLGRLGRRSGPIVREWGDGHCEQGSFLVTLFPYPCACIYDAAIGQLGSYYAGSVFGSCSIESSQVHAVQHTLQARRHLQPRLRAVPVELGLWLVVF